MRPKQQNMFEKLCANFKTDFEEASQDLRTEVGDIIEVSNEVNIYCG